MFAIRLLSGILLMIFFCFPTDAATVAEAKKDYVQNKNLLLKKKFLIRQDYIIAIGSTRLRGRGNAADIAARIDAQNNLLKAWESEKVIPGVPEYISPALVKKVFNGWKNHRRFNYQLKDCLILHKFSNRTATFCVVVCRKKDIKPTIDHKITWQMIYQDYKNLPQRNEMILYEIADPQELEALMPEIDKRLSVQTNQQFAAMFFGRDTEPQKASTKPEAPAPVASAGEPDLLELAMQKTTPAPVSGKSPLETLIAAVQNKPYNVELCRYLQQKFSALQMPRCARRMQEAMEKAQALQHINTAEEKTTPALSGKDNTAEPEKTLQKTEQK